METTKQQEFELTELIPGLLDEIALECLTRLHYETHAVASHVCQRWRRLLQSRDFYYTRKQNGLTRKAVCFVQSLPVQPTVKLLAEPETEIAVALNAKPEKLPKYGLSVFDPTTGIWDRIDAVPKYPDGLPLFCHVASTEGKLVVMGGWDPVSWDPLRDVFVYEFATRRWSKRADMTSNRSFFACCACDGKVYVAGGHDESKNALRSAWVYDIGSDEWTELTQMSEERDECEGVFIGSGFWVVSGYDTDSQGRFKKSAEVLDLNTGAWRRVEDAWRVSTCSRSCVAVGQDGNLTSWNEFDPAIQVGACGVDLGNRYLVSGSAYQGAPQAVFVVEKEKNKQGQNGKFVKVDVPDEFSGFVQSGCFVEI